MVEPTSSVAALDPIYIIGERNSGTNWVETLMASNFENPVSTTYCSFKHFMQLPCDIKPGLLVLVTRNPYDWLTSMHAKPYNAPSHQGVDFDTFLGKRWALDELGSGQNSSLRALPRQRAAFLAAGSNSVIPVAHRQHTMPADNTYPRA